MLLFSYLAILAARVKWC